LQGGGNGNNSSLEKQMQHTDKKENHIFLIYKEIQSGAVAKSYMTNGLLIYGEIFAHFPYTVLGSPSSYMTLQLLHSEFPYIFEDNLIFFFISAQYSHKISLAKSEQHRRMATAQLSAHNF
jgi:hypothetical protein